MRKVLAATLALTPMMVHAQALSPAQPKVSTHGQVLEARLVRPALFALTDPDRSMSMTPVRVTTGVTPPKLIHGVSFDASASHVILAPGAEHTVKVAFVVNEKGIPTDVKVIQSVNPLLDASVVSAVKKYRYQPGLLNNEPTAVPVNLEIVIHSSSM
ncbi:MAG: TonB family protein [Acidobacteriota bacterium]|nr:TonB family protein [Acidobacteriota bacterium]